MKARSSVVAALVALLVTAPAAMAVPTEATVRVEGSAGTLFEERSMVTDTRTVPVGKCAGGTATREIPGATALGALDAAAAANGFTYDTNDFGPGPGDLFTCRIGTDVGTFTDFWLYKVNHVAPMVGGGAYTLAPGDRVLWYFASASNPNSKTLDLAGPARVATSKSLAVEVNAYDGAGAATAADGAVVSATGSGGSSSATASADGRATLSLSAPGLYSLKASRTGDIRSNAIAVCVSETGAGDCGVPATQLGTPPRPGAVRDSKAPQARISGPRDGARYRRGPRVLRGTASDDLSGVTEVKLALRRHVNGGCRWWSGRRERFVGRGCRKKFFFAIGDDASWSYLLPRALPAGRYVLDVKAFDRSRNRDEQFVRGSNRAVFHVLGVRGARRAAGAGSSARRVRAAASGARLQVMVVGRTRTLVQSRTVRAAARQLRARGRQCAVAASTPLAALDSAIAGSTLGIQLRDFGRCTASDARTSAQLFVERVGPDRNAGQDGWVYKVGNRAGTAGAADATGPFGSGPLRDGARVLWFYCTLDAASASCQRTLALSRSSIRARRRSQTGVTARSYDNDGNGRPEPGVKLTLGGRTFTTGSDGKAKLRLPRRGRYLLRATKPGIVPAFPTRVRAR